MEGFIVDGQPVPGNPAPGNPSGGELSGELGNPAPGNPAPGNPSPLNPFAASGDNNPGNPAPSPPAPANPAPPGKTIQEQLDGMGLGAGLDKESLTNMIPGLQEEHAEKLSGLFTTALQKTFMQGASLTKDAMKAVKEELREEYKSQIASDMQADAAIVLLESKLPWAKNPGQRPMALAALNGFMKNTQGITMEQAVDKTVQYFQEMSTTLGRQFGQHTPTSRSPAAGGFDGPVLTGDEDDDPTDWSAFWKQEG